MSIGRLEDSPCEDRIYYFMSIGHERRAEGAEDEVVSKETRVVQGCHRLRGLNGLSKMMDDDMYEAN